MHCRLPSQTPLRRRNRPHLRQGLQLRCSITGERLLPPSNAVRLAASGLEAHRADHSLIATDQLTSHRLIPTAGVVPSVQGPAHEARLTDGAAEFEPVQGTSKAERWVGMQLS